MKHSSVKAAMDEALEKLQKTLEEVSLEVASFKGEMEAVLVVLVVIGVLVAGLIVAWQQICCKGLASCCKGGSSADAEAQNQLLESAKS